MTFTEQLYRALKLVQKALDADVPDAVLSRNCARAAHEWYERKFGQAVREAIARAERGSL
jgi:hypothetical protein